MVTTILLFLIGILIILGVARYYESDKIFWLLFTSFVGAYAAVTTARYVLSDEKKQSKEVVITSSPMQAPVGISYTMCSLADMSNLVTVKEKSFVPAGKDSTSKLTSPSLNEVGGGARDQPVNDSIMFDSS